MEIEIFSVNSRVRIISYGPFRGLKGTIRTIHHMPPLEEPFCFYQIELDGSHVKEPIWFTYEEVELLAPSENLPPDDSHGGRYLIGTS